MDRHSDFSFQGIDVSSSDIVSSYFNSISDHHCPYLRQSIIGGLTLLLRILEVNTLGEDGGEKCFWQSVKAIELFRKVRRKLPESTRHQLCFNLCLSNLVEFCGRENRPFDMPYWMLRCLYTRFGLMIGDFCVGERELDKNGVEIPTPPFYFFSIRSFVARPDQRFIIQAPALREDFLNADAECHDDPFLDFLGVSVVELLKSSDQVRASAYDEVRFAAERRRLYGLS